jgi:hypothetical protein
MGLDVVRAFLYRRSGRGHGMGEEKERGSAHRIKTYNGVI